MNIPKIQSVKVIGKRVILVEFTNKEKKSYDISLLLEQESFYPLKDFNFFKNFNIEKGGIAISWNEDIDISEYELWKNGKNCR